MTDPVRVEQVSGGILDQIDTKRASATAEELLLLSKALKEIVIPATVDDLINQLDQKKNEHMTTLDDHQVSLDQSYADHIAGMVSAMNSHLSTISATATARIDDVGEAGTGVFDIDKHLFERFIGLQII